MMMLVPFLVVPAVLVLIAILFVARVPREERRRLLFPVLIQPMFWIFAALWGRTFFIEPNRGTQPEWIAGWVDYPLRALPFLFALACFEFARRLPGSGAFLLPYSLANLYLVISVAFISGMAVSGTWL